MKKAEKTIKNHMLGCQDNELCGPGTRLSGQENNNRGQNEWEPAKQINKAKRG